MSAGRTVLVAGASGVVGEATVERFLADGWNVVGVSRRRPRLASTMGYRHLALDLRDARAVREGLRSAGPITALVYAALHELPGRLVAGWNEADQIAANHAMFSALLEPLAEAGSLRHVSLLQGTKAYGVHVHTIPVPAKESWPRDPNPNFYWHQEDTARDLAERFGFELTILRPQAIVGGAVGAAMNVITAIGAFGALAHELELPFGFPGGPASAHELVDSRLIADALVWAVESSRAWGETFNITNGDAFEWRTLWPGIAAELGHEPAPDEPRSLRELLESEETARLWSRIVARENLHPLTLAALLGQSAEYADHLFAYDQPPSPPMLVSTIKLREAGFGSCIDSERSVRHWLGELMRLRYLPEPTSRHTI